jgi:V8-like Glu-specific endopeptidase
LEDSAFLSGLIYKYKLIYPANPTKLTEAGVPESYVNKTLSFLDGPVWVKRIQEIMGQVCRIDAGTKCGSGFLISPDLVLTNYHVVERVINKSVPAAEVVLRFDYTQEGGGVPVSLAGDWLVDYSEYDPEEFRALEPKEVSLDKLDYALVRLGTRAGDVRGWVTQAQINAEHDFLIKPALFIVQHPGCQPLKIALDTNAVISVRKNGSRVRYRTNTQPGSSGSPCFDENWNLVALHHSGDPDRTNALWNEGIPIKAVLELLKQRGKLDGLG